MLKKKRVLVIEDDLVSRGLIEAALLDHYSITFCENVDQAELQLSNHDIVLTDHKPSGRPGLDLMKTTSCPIPVIGMSGMSRADIESLEKPSFGGKLTTFLQKPFEPKTLLEEISKGLKSKRKLLLKVLLPE